MRRRLILVLPPLVILGACATSGGTPPSPAPAASADLHVGFPAGGVADTITINVVDRLPLRAAELVAPEGGTSPADWINVDASPRVAAGQWVAGNPWETTLAGSSAAAALTTPNAEANAALRSQVQLLATVSQAEIPLPDPIAYRRDWAHYRVRLTFGMPPGEVEAREIPAPEPPPLPAAPPVPVPPPG
jgi:hypothetical protein